jgi:RNA recognition motif-containing protein
VGKKLYVRNLAASVSSATLEDMFMAVGNVESATVNVDPQTGASLRSGYVEMSTETEAVDCIHRFNGQNFNGQILIVTEDKPHVPSLDTFKAKRRKIADTKQKSRTRTRKDIAARV